MKLGKLNKLNKLGLNQVILWADRQSPTEEWRCQPGLSIQSLWPYCQNDLPSFLWPMKWLAFKLLWLTPKLISPFEILGHKKSLKIAAQNCSKWIRSRTGKVDGPIASKDDNYFFAPLKDWRKSIFIENLPTFT